MFHYGWVKDPKTMLEKKREQASVYHGANLPPAAAKELTGDAFRFEDYGILKEFRGSHPAVMKARISPTCPWGRRRTRWLNWRFYREVARRGFRG
jgi:hypothetical protein